MMNCENCDRQVTFRIKVMVEEEGMTRDDSGEERTYNAQRYWCAKCLEDRMLYET